MRAMRILVLGWIGVVAASMAAAAPAYDKLDRGPRIGQALPIKLVAPDQTGKTRDLASLTGKRGLLLVFNRSVDWCVYCRAEAVDWNRRLGDVRALGYRVAVISYDSLSAIKNFSEGRGIKYTLLSDKGSKIIRAFGLLNEGHPPGSFGHGIPHPIVFAIDPKGVIRHRFSEATYRRRPNIDTVLKVLRMGASNGS
ncbi:MAG: peroxiredoxin family protein [Alphaproteobacteria bacterium]|nr:peroxiredoxin family protein [Alphaproteobacteria bacterium]